MEGTFQMRRNCVRSHGLRSNTRDKFAKPFRGHGKPLPSKYLTTYKVGEYVDIAADSSIHKGMPHKFYHGRTGRVFDVTPRSIGVEVNKEVNGRILVKRIHVRVEHVRPSRCQEAFKALVRARDAARRAARAAGEPKVIHEKRQPAGPRPARVVQVGAGGIKHLEAKPYEFIC
jgi:large subunit ribosomal protein L21e